MPESILQDLRYGIRRLLQSPGFTLVAVLSLALGIGANTAIFQLVDAIRLKTLPVENPRELAYVNFADGSTRSGWFSTRSARFTYAQWQELRKHQEPFRGMFAWSAARFNLAKSGEARYAEGLYVSGDFFPVLGVKAMMGRTITPEDDGGACNAGGAVLSHAFWQREFGADPAILSRTITLDGHPMPVIGVTPEGFFGVEVGNRYDLAIPVCADALLADNKKGRMPVRHAWWLSAMGRLKPGWTIERATAYLRSVSPAITSATLPEQYKPDTAKKYLANKIEASEGGTGVSGLRRRYQNPLWILMATTGLVLLIACANLANLLLARASVQEREISVRLAIGASRWRLIRQLLVESLLLAVGGTALGAGLAQALSRGMVAFLDTSNSPLFVGLDPSWRVLSFMAGLALLTCLLFGLVPALRATRMAPVQAIRSGGRTMTDGKERFSLRRILVATQVALSLVLLVGALLFVRSLGNLTATDAGFHAEGILTLYVDYRHAGYSSERRHAVNRELRERLAAVPGVLSAAQVLFTPVSGAGWNNDVGPDGTKAAGSGKLSFFNRAGIGYFRAMGTPLIAGREFNERDTLGAPKVAVVNETFAKKFFGGANPVGRTFRLEAPAGKPEPLIQIVGLVKSTKYYELREEFLPIAFLTAAQDEEPGPNAGFVIRVSGVTGAVTAAIRRTIADMNPTMGLEFRAFSTQIQESLLRDRLMAVLSSAFGLLAGLLATLGLYGVISYMVARRRNEIGIRVALGADRGRVVRLVLREAILLLCAGLAAGGMLALWTGRAASTLLYGVEPHDPLSLSAACALLAAVTLAASLGPARRAATVDPMVALRNE